MIRRVRDHPIAEGGLLDRRRCRRIATPETAIEIRENVSFVPGDFEKVSLATALPQAGVDLRSATFFSMLGVSQYLTEIAFAVWSAQAQAGTVNKQTAELYQLQ